MKSTYLVAVSVVMLAIAIIGLLMATVAVETLPTAMPDRMAAMESIGTLPAGADAVTFYRGVETAGLARFLAGDDNIARLDASARAYDAAPRGGDRMWAFADELRLASQRALQHAAIMIVILLTLALAGLLGLVRLRVPAMVALGGAMLGLATIGGLGLIAFTGGASLAWALAPPCVLALLAQATAANLLPEPPNPLIARLERELRGRVSTRARAGYLAARFAIGAVVAAAGGELALCEPTAGYVAIVMIFVGASCIVAPLIALVRMRLADAELPAARVVT